MKRAILPLLLLMHAGLLTWQGWRYSPTIDEPVHLVAGISHWKFGRFDLYRVNPPLVRLVAALPMLLADPKTDWSGFTEAPYARPEFTLGTTFANANGADTFWHFTLARWACIPFSLLGGYVCYRWARDLYGGTAGLIALVLWCFCPNILGNGALITPDVAAASLGVTAAFCFWRWLALAVPPPVGWAVPTTTSNAPAENIKSTNDIEPGGQSPPCKLTDSPSPRAPGSERLTAGETPAPQNTTSRSAWPRALLAGLTLGLAELTKSTWIILFALWPVLWLIWKLRPHPFQFSISNFQFSIFNLFTVRKSVERGPPTAGALGCASRLNDRRAFAILHPRSSILQLSAILLLALYLLNLGYGFENSFQRLDRFQFISRAIGGPDAHTTPGNRFANTWLGKLPVPAPANYVHGIDVQRYDFEIGKWSYLRGEQKMGGWWHYYLYAMAVKTPVGTLFLFALATLSYAFNLLNSWRKPSDTTLGCASRLNDNSPPSILHPRSSILDCLVLLSPALALLLLVSSQTGFNRYLRYVLPAFPFLFIWTSQVGRFCTMQRTRGLTPLV